MQRSTPDNPPTPETPGPTARGVPSRNPEALGYMAAASFSGSWIPLVVHLTQASQTPFLFNALLKAGVILGVLLFLASTSRTAHISIQDLHTIRKHILVWPANRTIMVSTLGSLYYALFALSTRFIQIPVSTILFEMYPVGIIIAVSWLFRDTGRYNRLTPRVTPPVLLALTGLVFANASQLPGFGALTPAFLWTSLIGITLVLLGIISASFAAFGLRWGADLNRELSPEPAPIRPESRPPRPRNTQSPSPRPRNLELQCTLLAVVIIAVLSIPPSIALGLASGETIDTRTAIAALAAGFSANTALNITLRKAILITDNLGINAISFTTPVLSIIWLHLIANTSVARWDYLLIGTTAIIAANLWIKFQASSFQLPASRTPGPPAHWPRRQPK